MQQKFGDCPVEVPKEQIIEKIVQAPIKKEVHPQDKFGDCPVEVPKVQIIDKIMQVPVKKEAQSQEKVM